MTRSLPVLLSLVFFFSFRAQTTEFSQDSAYAILTRIVVEIGPRPMGSPAEREALQFAVDKFMEYGCQQSYVMPMTVAGTVNTTSGIAVGVLPGKTNRIIVIGGHIDSSDPEVPGANDDASGVACVIEVARVLAKRQHESTILFACWGGEEQGLRGSKHFVKNFDGIDSVVLMLQIDMADGAGVLLPDPEDGKRIAPRWLVEETYKMFYDELRYAGLAYDAHIANLNVMFGGFYGSDHVAFLERGIPAIDFTSDVDYPIHTPQDNLANFTPSGLKRTGDLIVKLVERFDAGVPSQVSDMYMILQVGERPLFLDYWMLWSFVGISVLMGVGVFARTRKRRVVVEGAPKVKWSGFKVVLFVLFVQTCAWSSESLVGLIRGYRFPWVNNFGGFFFLGILFGLIGLWMVLQLVNPESSVKSLAGRLRLSSDPFTFARVAIILFLVAVLLMSLAGPRSGIYPAAGLFFFSVAILVRNPVAKLVFIAASPYAMYRLLFGDSIGLFQRLLSENTTHGFLRGGLYEAGFVVLYSIISLPFVFGFVAVYRDSGVDLLWLKKFSNKLGLIGVSVVTLGTIVCLLGSSVYDERWYNNVHVDQRITAGSDSSTITLRGSEYFAGLELNMDGRDTVLPPGDNVFEFKVSDPLASSRSAVRATDSLTSRDEVDSLVHQFRRVEIRS
ncbi:MAG: Zn-dependent exopeptidase M28, partial [Ignavibacteriae bacterium]|nr:Zn-dependent exopeptidase M28 [Ignavibacteriota bacterium]